MKTAPRPIPLVTLVETVAVAIWTMLPAYVPNNAAVLAGGSRDDDRGGSNARRAPTTEETRFKLKRN